MLLLLSGGARAFSCSAAVRKRTGLLVAVASGCVHPADDRLHELNFLNFAGILAKLDALAKSGVVLKNYYVAHLLANAISADDERYTTHWAASPMSSLTLVGVPPTRLSCPSTKRAGCRTRSLKWHLGMYRKEYTPPVASTSTSAICRAASRTTPSPAAARRALRQRHRLCVRSGRRHQGLSRLRLVQVGRRRGRAGSQRQPRQLGLPHPRCRYRLYLAPGARRLPLPALYLPFQNIHDPYTCDLRTASYESQPTRFSDGEMTILVTSRADDESERLSTRSDGTSATTPRSSSSSDNGADGWSGRRSAARHQSGLYRAESPLPRLEDVRLGRSTVPGFIRRLTAAAAVCAAPSLTS